MDINIKFDAKSKIEYKTIQYNDCAVNTIHVQREINKKEMYPYIDPVGCNKTLIVANCIIVIGISAIASTAGVFPNNNQVIAQIGVIHR